MLRLCLCDYNDAYILVSGNRSISSRRMEWNNDLQIVFKNCASSTNSKSEINNKQMDNAKGINEVMPMYNLIKYSGNYSKACGSLWQYYRDETVLINADALDGFPCNSASFEFKQMMVMMVMMVQKMFK